jgi:hypothetical protein
VDQTRGLNAVDVSHIPTNFLDWDAARRGVDLSRLPVVLVANPEDLSQRAAVLSWRWDRPIYDGRSRNVALALIHARRVGIRYLFFDLVSIDQKQPTETLLQQVVALARLYSQIPVIAAYDQEAVDMMQWSFTLRRPWILYEIRSYSVNPTSITYVGFQHSENNRRQLSFENEIWLIRKSGFADVVLDILHGRVQMTSIKDFRLILPPFERIFSMLAEAFNRDDYLLAVFLLTAADERPQLVERDGRQVNYGFRTDVGDPGFEKMELQRFSVGPLDGGDFAYESKLNILFDGSTVAICRSKMTTSFDRVWIEVLPSLAGVLHRAVGLDANTLSEYENGGDTRRAVLYVDKTGPKPDIDEAIAQIDIGTWSINIPRPQGESLGFTPKAKSS